LVDAMADLLCSSAAELDQMGRSGRTRVAESHVARTEAAKLAALFASPATTVDRPNHRRIAVNSVAAR
jgi:hypothetical protein